MKILRRLKQWAATKLYRWVLLHQIRTSHPDVNPEDEKKLKKLASSLVDGGGPVEDYTAKFKEMIDTWMKPKPVTFMAEGIMSEAGVAKFNDPNLGPVANARVRAASWLFSDGKGGWTSKDLGFGEKCVSGFQREVLKPYQDLGEKLQMESRRDYDAKKEQGLQVEGDPWGTTPDPLAFGNDFLRSSTTLEKNLPYPPGPFTKQIYLPDMWKLDALVFQFCNYSGLAKRAIAIKAAYIMGNGIKIKFQKEKIQQLWDAFEDTTGFYDVLLRWVCQWLKYGELNINPWILPGGKLRVRSIDRSTIWDQVTNPEDIYDIHGYWVQFATQYQLYTDGADGVKMPYTEYVMRMMPAESIIQLKRNVDENEKRGRSDLIAGLAVCSYYDDTVRALVIEQIMRSSWVWDVEVQFGDQSDVDQEAKKAANKVVPGSTWFHTSSLKRTLVNAQGMSQSKSSATQEVVGAFAVAVGVPEEFFGMAGQSNKAAALTGTAPFVKETQVDQKLLETGVRKLVNFWLEGTNHKGEKFECIFPEIAPADMYTKIQAVVLAQTSGYYSIERAATMTSKELNDTTFDWNMEKEKIDKEKDALMADNATENNLYPGGHSGQGSPRNPMVPQVPQPGAGLAKLKSSGDKVTGPAGAGDKLDSSGVGT